MPHQCANAFDSDGYSQDQREEKTMLKFDDDFAADRSDCVLWADAPNG
jgi:hypothetical protein